ncbi:MAG: glycoside hydrolase family 19 protein [Proteobacteria bacterium]
MKPLTAEQLQQIVPRCPDPQVWSQALNATMALHGIEGADRIAAFIAQLAHESGGFRRLSENLTYTSAARICAVWPKRFADEDSARPFVRNPEALANRVYANRLGNGTAGSGDGWRYRGRGLLQITGRANYDEAGRALGLALLQEPDRLLEPVNAARSAAWFWQTRGLNALADDRSDDDDDGDFVSITKIINGGTTGLSERRRYWAQARRTLGLD